MAYWWSASGGTGKVVLQENAAKVADKLGSNWELIVDQSEEFSSAMNALILSEMSIPRGLQAFIMIMRQAERKTTVMVRLIFIAVKKYIHSRL
jgi:hypothetical protein